NRKVVSWSKWISLRGNDIAEVGGEQEFIVVIEGKTAHGRQILLDPAGLRHHFRLAGHAGAAKLRKTHAFAADGVTADEAVAAVRARQASIRKEFKPGGNRDGVAPQ